MVSLMGVMFLLLKNGRHPPTDACIVLCKCGEKEETLDPHQPAKTVSSLSMLDHNSSAVSLHELLLPHTSKVQLPPRAKPRRKIPPTRPTNGFY